MSNEFRAVPVASLVRLMSLIDPAPVQTEDGQTMVFKNPMAADILTAISAEVRAMMETPVPMQAHEQAYVTGLAAIGEQISTQDNRCTDQPLFAVMEKRGMITLDTHDHDRIEWVETTSGDYCEADETKARRLEALHQGHRDTPGWERYAVKDVDVFVTACFTEQGCKDFLSRDGHNHRRPFIYAFGSYRNSEYQAVRNWLKALSAPKGHCDRPPTGWTCSREPGHDGPCAATPVAVY
jgi:hypothetical protein